jgi:transcription initiation factor TFIIIB Brf1 subunit/transcription initiation factor TFIIB
MIKKCSDCAGVINGDGVCPVCGLVDDEHGDFANELVYPYDDEKVTHYGDPISIAISDISVMTRINPRETYSKDFRRAIEWDGRYGWDVEKTEIVNAEIKRICSELDLKAGFKNTCFLFFKVYKQYFSFIGKKLENIAGAIIYLMIRIYNLAYTLYDFKRIDFKVSTIYRYYGEIIRKLDIYKLIRPQDPKIFIVKFVNELIPDYPTTYNAKYELTKYIILLFDASFNINKGDDIFQTVGLGSIGACLWIAAKKSDIFHFTQKQISEICGISEVTLRQYIKKIKKNIQS